MDERWVCKRCFADNPGRNDSCEACALARGADAAPAEVNSWRASHAVAAAGAPPPMGQLLRLWWVPVLAALLIGGWAASARRADDGTLVSGGGISVHQLRVGDCLDMGDAAGVTNVRATPCSEAHEFEVFHTFAYPGEAFPAPGDMDETATAGCRDAFEPYVGTSWGASRLHLVPLTPSQESWSGGDRTIICLLFDPMDDRLTGSARGSGR